MSKLGLLTDREMMARKRLQKGRCWAVGLLILAALIFVASHIWGAQYAVTGYIRAFAEAAMVGALADWFAVTALFRRPFGLPIPHTAILPRNQSRIADELGGFIERNFLQPRPIVRRIVQAKPAERLLTWAAQPQQQAKWLPWLASKTPMVVRLAKPEEVARFGSMLLATHYSGAQIGKTLSDGLVALKQRHVHHLVMHTLLQGIQHWLAEPTTQTMLEQYLRRWAAQIDSEAPSAWQKFKAGLKGTIVEKVDDWAAAKALVWAGEYIDTVLHMPDHDLYQRVDNTLDKWIHALAHSPELHQRLEGYKQQLATSPMMQQRLAELWRLLENWVETDAAKGGDSAQVRQFERWLQHMQQQAVDYPQFMRRMNRRLALMAGWWLERYRHRIAEFVADKVKAWDSSEMVDKLELSVGKDLQFIRINGTLVGGLVGLAIYTVSQWLGWQG